MIFDRVGWAKDLEYIWWLEGIYTRSIWVFILVSSDSA